MFHKLLVAVDGYPPSLGAAKAAVELASHEGAEVVALQVVEDVPLLQLEKELEADALTADQSQPLIDPVLINPALYSVPVAVLITVLVSYLTRDTGRADEFLASAHGS
jgi:nucleotide-binding universal stress UspA family protein